MMTYNAKYDFTKGGQYTWHTAESVGRGHPDKIADRISDAVMMYFLNEDIFKHTAVETLVCGSDVTIAGEVEGSANPLYLYSPNITAVIHEIVPKAKITNLVRKRNEELNNIATYGAGDQGIMVGYACNENEDYLPSELYWARKLLRIGMQSIGLDTENSDGKCQVTVRLCDGRLDSIEHLVISLPSEREDMVDVVRTSIKEALPMSVVKTKIDVNPGGSWTVSGSYADTGVTGRKIIADTYGPRVPHGGGAFSGKDPSKLDRSGAYMARYLAKELVTTYQASEATVKLSYMPGEAQPVHIDVNTHSNSEFKDSAIAGRIRDKYDLSAEGIIEFLKLRDFNYRSESYVDV